MSSILIRTAFLLPLLMIQTDTRWQPIQFPFADDQISQRIQLKAGDVVFISVPTSFWGTLASRWSSPRYKHTHVGIAAISESGKTIVVHANGNPTKKFSKVEANSLGEFLADAARVDVFRPNNLRAAHRASEAAKRFVHEELIFDTSFSLASTRSLYCTELVWRALNEGYNRDILPSKHYFAGRAVIRLLDLETVRELQLAGTMLADI